MVFWRLDRLTRSLSDLCELVDYFEEINIKISCVTEPYDTTTANGLLMIQIKGALSEHERRLTLERSKLGMRARVREGKWKGGRTPFGYSYDSTTERLRINKKEVKIVKIIFQKYLEIRTINGVTSYLNEHKFPTRKAENWSNTAVGNILQRKLYIGKYECSDQTKTMPELKRIDKQVYHEVQKLRKKRKVFGPTPHVKKRKRIDGIIQHHFSANQNDRRINSLQNLGGLI